MTIIVHTILKIYYRTVSVMDVRTQLYDFFTNIHYSQ
jgi:hypothetical protein